MLDTVDKSAMTFQRGAYVIMTHGPRMQRLGAIVQTLPVATVLMYNHDTMEWKPHPVEFSRERFVRMATQADLLKFRYTGVSSAPGYRIRKERLKRRLPVEKAEQIADALFLASKSLTPEQFHSNITGIIKMYANGESLVAVIGACRPKVYKMRGRKALPKE